MTMTREEIAANSLTNTQGRAWAYRETIARMGQQGTKETEIAPLLNIRLNEVKIETQNPLTQIIGKLNIAQTDYFKNQDNKLYAISEIGYMELGNNIKIALMPGEIIPGLVTGTGDTVGEDVLSGNDFGYPSLNELAGGEVNVFGLANDAIGYVISDNDYTLFYIGNPNSDGLSSKLFGYNYTHYQELFSMGKHTASTLITDFKKMFSEIKKSAS
ncbi:hypothetical protein SDC9_167053 [bioreactor metagenome]|uniref:Uncharacterized protein n=1 Tax=bioreactor metagenome TaxID=1076179 RepID=A0A645FYQ4_9ZZZZ